MIHGDFLAEVSFGVNWQLSVPRTGFQSPQTATSFWTTPEKLQAPVKGSEIFERWLVGFEDGFQPPEEYHVSERVAVLLLSLEFLISIALRFLFDPFLIVMYYFQLLHQLHSIKRSHRISALILKPRRKYSYFIKPTMSNSLHQDRLGLGPFPLIETPVHAQNSIVSPRSHSTHIILTRIETIWPLLRSRKHNGTKS